MALGKHRPEHGRPGLRPVEQERQFDDPGLRESTSRVALHGPRHIDDTRLDQLIQLVRRTENADWLQIDGDTSVAIGFDRLDEGTQMLFVNVAAFRRQAGEAEAVLLRHGRRGKRNDRRSHGKLA